MEITKNHVESVTVIGITGELDAKSSPELTQFINDQLQDGNINLVADLKDLKYSSSAGIRIFLGSAKQLRQDGGDLRIAAVQPQVEKIFKLSRFDRIVKIFPNVEEAVKSYKEVIT